MKLFLCISMLLSNFSFAGEVSDLYENEFTKSKFSTSYLGKMPRFVSIEELRWLYPPIKQSDFFRLNLKGTFLFIPKINEERNRYIFSAEHVQDKNQILSFSPNAAVFKNGKQICGHSPLHYPVPKRVFKCKNYKCSLSSDKLPRHPMEFDFYAANSNDKCSFPNLGIVSDDIDKPGDLIPFDSIDPEKKNIFKKYNENIYKVDTSLCASKSINCEIGEKKLSGFEQAWINKEIIKEFKKDDVLDSLILNLLPCVKKRDSKCVSKFLNISSIQINEELYDELEACLKYESILPFGGRLKGIKKACFIGGMGVVVGIDYPEAFDEVRHYYYVEQ